MALLLDFVKARENPFIINGPKVTLNSFVTKQIVNDIVKARFLKTIENGEATHTAFRNERFLVGSNKLSFTISKVKLSAFNSQDDIKKTNTEATKSKGHRICIEGGR